MTAPALRNKSIVIGGGASSGAGTEPSGAALNDILIYQLFVEDEGVNYTITDPSGWTVLATWYDTVSGSHRLKAFLYVIRRTGSAPSYTITYTGGSPPYTEYSVSAYSGCKTSGSAVNASAFNSTNCVMRANGNVDAPSVTSTVNDCLIVAGGISWAGVASGSFGMPSGYTLVENSSGGGTGSGTVIGYKALPTAGAEDPAAFTGAANVNDPCVEWTVALEPIAVAAGVPFSRVAQLSPIFAQ